MKKVELDFRRKNKIKFWKVLSQSIILIALIILLVQVVFNIKQYDEPDKTKWHNATGFIAISYFGVDRSGSPKLIAKDQLNKQLKALSDQGYQTISQKDILNFYKNNKPLPNKALFLSFEDGRNDSSIFAQPLLEKYNYKATFLSYANKMGNDDRKFVQPKDMLKMKKTGYWELGTNGYRLTYINVYDSDGNYVGMKNENQLRNKKNIGHYNHYLMDFIRDENMIPTEHRAQMENRINKDYSYMKKIYKDQLGYVPDLYMIMHANTLNNGMNNLVSNVNNQNIESVFRMHFNKEGNAFNDNKRDIYDLSRIQPEPYWQTNHLLMKLKKDSDENIEFIQGDQKRAKEWRTVKGAAEFLDGRIIVTSNPKDIGQIRLSGSDEIENVKISTDLTGNVVGKQAIYLRKNSKDKSYIRLTLNDNVIEIDQKSPEKQVERILTKKLDSISWNPENLAMDKATVYSWEQSVSGNLIKKDEYPVNIMKKRHIQMSLEDRVLNVVVDGKSIINNYEIDQSITKGEIALQSAYSQQNKKDDIYDGIFDDLKIEYYNKNSDKPVSKYTSGSTGVMWMYQKIQKYYNQSIDWIIDTF